MAKKDYVDAAFYFRNNPRGPSRAKIECKLPRGYKVSITKMWVCIFGKTHKDKCDETRGYIERVLHVKVRRQEIDGVVTMFYARFSNYLGVHVKPGPLTGTLPGVIGSTIRFEDYNQVFLFSKYTDFTITSQPYICAKFVYINELYIKNMLKPPNINAKKYNNSTRNKAIIIRGKPKKHIKYKMM